MYYHVSFIIVHYQIYYHLVPMEESIQHRLIKLKLLVEKYLHKIVNQNHFSVNPILAQNFSLLWTILNNINRGKEIKNKNLH